MATKGKKTSTKKASTAKTNVTRIVASDAKKAAPKAKATPKAKPVEPADKTTASTLGRIGTPFFAMGRYFKGAWYELRQVRWPNRKATWSLTAAMLVFTGFFVILILLLDALFKYLFELILG